MIHERAGLSLRMLWLAHWYATGERAFPLPTSHGPLRRDGAGS